jgi:hypothetical protein
MGMGIMEKLMAERESGFMKLRNVFLGSGFVVSVLALEKRGIASEELIIANTIIRSR